MNSATQLAEQTMGTLWELKESGDLNPSINLLRSLGHSPVAVAFGLDPDSYYFPNLRGDTFVRPVGIHSDRIPVVALEVGQTYRFERPSLHSLQHQALLAAGVSALIVNDIHRGLAREDDEIRSHRGSAGTASIRTTTTRLSSTPAKVVESKPLLILNTSESDDVVDSYVGVALHEIVHIIQMLHNPFRVNNNALQRELEAYAVQAKLVHSDKIPYVASTRSAGEVDNFRKKYLGEDSFTPTPEFNRVFKQNAMFARIWANL